MQRRPPGRGAAPAPAQRLLWLPEDEDLLEELRNVRLRETSLGRSFASTHDEGQHDDRAIALALAASKLLDRPPSLGDADLHWEDVSPMSLAAGVAVNRHARLRRQALAVDASEELGECLGEHLGMGQGGGVPGAGDLVHPCVGDVVGHVPRAGGQERLGARPVQHQHRS